MQGSDDLCSLLCQNAHFTVPLAFPKKFPYLVESVPYVLPMHCRGIPEGVPEGERHCVAGSLNRARGGPEML